MAHPLIISTSLNPQSRSANLASLAAARMTAQGCTPKLIELIKLDLPLCDGGACYAHPQVAPLAQAIAGASAVLIASPIYNYDLNAAAKNLLELTGKAWTGKLVGFLCAAGGEGSYMSVMPYANSLMLDYRCLIIPRFVYATGGAFTDGILTSTEVLDRVHQLADTTLELARRLA